MPRGGETTETEKTDQKGFLPSLPEMEQIKCFQVEERLRSSRAISPLVQDPPPHMDIPILIEQSLCQGEQYYCSPGNILVHFSIGHVG